jgi:4-amino-4-deoxy-L-arabinose transferase-like glycosyltransferase
MTRQAPVAALQTVFGSLALPALVIGLLGLLWELIRPRRDRRRSLAVAMTAILVALLARVAVVAVIDAMSYSASRNPQYVIPGADLLVLLASAGCWLFGAHVYDLVQARRSDNRCTAGAEHNSEARGLTTDAIQAAPASD